MRKEQAEYLIDNSNGKFFTVEFIKKNGDLRKMNCRIGVSKYVTGKGLTFEPSDYNLRVVFDLQKHDYRMINLETVRRIIMNGHVYE